MSEFLFDPISEYKYIFYPAVDKSNSMDSRVWKVCTVSGDDMEDTFYNEYNNICVESNLSLNAQIEISAEFGKFKENRPEYYLHPFDFGQILDTLETLKDKYDELLAACMLCSYGIINDEETELNVHNKITKVLNWLNTTDFYYCPASTKYHEAYDYGLLEHTIKVVKNIVELYSLSKFKDVKLYEAITVALVHDYCKIGKYKQYMRNVPPDESGTGNWEKVPAFKCNTDTQFPFGHGAGSMYIAQSLFKLTMEQKLAVRWHMGRWYVADIDVYDLQYANENYPLVFMIQFADQLAATNY